MPSDGRGAMEQFTAVYRLLNEQESKPILVHCNAGVRADGRRRRPLSHPSRRLDDQKALDELRSFERRGQMTVELQKHVRQMAVQVGDAMHR